MFWHFPAYLQAYKKSGLDFRATPFSIVRSGEWKLIYFYESDSFELYNLDEDIMEKNNVAAKYPKVADTMVKKLKKWISDTDAPIPTKKNPYYESTL